MKEAVDQARDRVENLSRDQSQMEREESVFQSEWEKLDIQTQNLKDKLFENHQFKLGEDSFIPEWEDVSVEALKESIENLERETEKIGAVNLVALKERDDLMEKNDFLRTQKEDLTKSRIDLLKVISHIDGICDKRFSVMLEEINLRFARIFPLIFNGDDAEARLNPSGRSGERGNGGGYTDPSSRKKSAECSSSFPWRKSSHLPLFDLFSFPCEALSLLCAG